MGKDDPGIDVVPVGSPTGPAGQDPYLWFMQTQVPVGEGPDVFFIHTQTPDCGVYGDKGLMVPLDAYLQQPNPYAAAGEPGSQQWIDGWGSFGRLSQTVNPAGRYYCLPLGAGAVFLYYNKTVTDKLGIEVPVPISLNELNDILRKLQDAGYKTPIQGQLGPSMGWDDYIFHPNVIEPWAVPAWELHYNPCLIDGYLDTEEFARAVSKGLFKADSPQFRDLLNLQKSWVPLYTSEWKTGEYPAPNDFLSGRQGRLLPVWWLVHRYHCQQRRSQFRCRLYDDATCGTQGVPV